MHVVCRHFQLGQRPLGRQRDIFRQCQRAHLVDHARQPAFAEANVVEQAKAELSGETGPQRNSGEPWRERRLPFARHDQRLSVFSFAQLVCELALSCDSKTAARQVGDDCPANSGHVVGERRAQGAADDIDGPIGILRAQQLDDRMAADEVADPDERDDHHRSSGLIELVTHGSRAARPRSAPMPGRAKQGVTLRTSDMSSRDFYPVVSVLQA